MALKKKNKVISMFTISDYERMSQEYDEISAQIKALESKKKSLSEQLKTGAQELGVKDDRGSYYCDTETYVFGAVAKKSVKFNLDKAIPFLRDKDLSGLIEEVTTYVIDEDGVKEAVSEGLITLDEVRDITDTTVSYSVSVKAKEVAEVEQTTLVAAKRK